MKNKKILILIFILLILTSQLFADNISANGAQFLRLGLGAKAAGMADAYIASCDNTSSIYWNPAGLSKIENKSIIFMHGLWFENINYDWIGCSIPTKFGGFGLGIQYINYGDLDKLDDDGYNIGKFYPSDKLISLSYGQKFNVISFGLTAKYFESIITKQATAYSLDIGIQTDIIKNFVIGAIARNCIGSKIKYKNYADKLPQTIELGVAYTKIENIKFELDLKKPEDTDLYYSAGIDYNKKIMDNKTANLRCGYTNQYKNIEGFTGTTLGLGLNFGNYNLDYTYKPTGVLGNNHIISLSLDF